MQGPPTDAASAAVMDAVRRIVQALRRTSRAAEVEYGLSGAQLFVLQKLAEADAPLSLGELAERTVTHPSSVSVVAARLVERGFAARAPSAADGRRAEMRLTSKGRSILRRAAPETAQDQLLVSLAAMPLKSRTHLAALLGELVVGAGFAGDDAVMFFEEV